MNVYTKNQEGSLSRDRFKSLHKQMIDKTAYACDVDLVLIEKTPIPFMVALLDFKTAHDSVTFTEAILYQQHIEAGTPVYLIYATPDFKKQAEDGDLTDRNEIARMARETHRFTVKRLISADYRPNPPTTEQETVVEDVDWAGFAAWQMELRLQRKREKLQWLRQRRAEERHSIAAD
jgi:hypothetical protein